MLGYDDIHDAASPDNLCADCGCVIGGQPCERCAEPDAPYATFGFFWPNVGTFYTVHGGTHDRSSVCEATLMELGIAVPERAL